MDNFGRTLENSDVIGDELDIRIINALQETPRATYSTLARTLETSESTIRRRMNSLFEGNKLRVMAIPDPAINGFPASAMVLIRTGATNTRSVIETVRNMWQTTYVGEVVGTFSVACIVRETSLEALTCLVHDVLESIPGVQQVDANVVTRVIKGWGEWKMPLLTMDSGQETEYGE